MTLPGLDLLSFRLAVNQLRGGVRGLWLLIACMALGVAAMTGVNGISSAIEAALDEHGSELLGGDLAAARMHVRATPADRSVLERFGRVSEVATLRAMARTGSAGAGGGQALVEVKAVDTAYPLSGALTLGGGVRLTQALARPMTAVVDPLLLARLGLKVGDRIGLGLAEVEIAGTIETEPDRLSNQAFYGPRLMTRLETLEAAGLAGEGSLVRWQYKVKSDPSVGALNDDQLKVRSADLSKALGDGAFQMQTRLDPVPGARRAVDRLGQFLTLAGFVTLGIGGLGVANAVAAHLIRMRKTVGTLRSLGAGNGRVFGIYLAQVLVLTLAGIALGLLLGAFVPELVLLGTGQFAPVALRAVYAPWAFAGAALFGLLVALLFTVWPLGRAEQLGAAALFRGETQPALLIPPRMPYWLATVAIATLLFGLLLLASADRTIAAYSAGGLALIALLLLAAGWLLQAGAARLPRFGAPPLRLALDNIGGHGSLARPVMLSLGTGLGLLIALALVDQSLETELKSALPTKAPNYYLLDIKSRDMAALGATLSASLPGARLDARPMLRARIVALKGVPAEKIQAPRGMDWFLEGDRGISFSATPPEGTRFTSGDWWTADYKGPPLLSLDEEIAKAFSLGLGDEVGLNVLGRPLTARIANVRKAAPERLSMNVTMVLSPEPLIRAPHNLLASLSAPVPPGPETEGRLMQALATAYPNMAVIRVRDGIDIASAVIDKVILAVRIAAVTTLAAGGLVLLGAMAAARRRRAYQAVLLKVLGARPRTVIYTMMLEYGLLALAATLAALALGTLSAWLLLRFGMQVPFIFSGYAVALSALSALGLVLAFGAFGTWQVMRARPMTLLRAE